MSDPLQAAQDACHAAIHRLADAGHRAANEHSHALDALRAEVESLRVINKGLRERLAALDAEAPVDAGAPRDKLVWGKYDGRRACCLAGGDINAPETKTRSALEANPGQWWLFRPCEAFAFGADATEAQAIAWVLDGVLP